MAVTTDVQDILNGAYGKNLKNQPGAIATETPELLNVVTRIHRAAYAFAARINPIFFGDTDDVAESSGVWARPENAEAIVRIETAAFVEIIVVPFDDQGAEDSKLSLYEFGGAFNAVTNTAGTTSGTLTFWFSNRPAAYAALADVLAADWQEEFNELLILELAIYLAAKDGRFEEVAFLARERDRWASLFGLFLQHATSNLRRRIGNINRINVETLVPLFFNTPTVGG